MFAHLCLIVGVWMAADVNLPNGIRVIDMPSSSDSFEIVAGYQVRNSPLRSIISTFLLSTDSARSMALAAYAAGGEVRPSADLESAAIRIKGPAWVRPSIEKYLAEFLAETPQENAELVARAIAAAAARPAGDFRSKVESELRAAVLGPVPDLETDAAEIERFFRDHFATDRAFVVASGSFAGDDLHGVPSRKAVRNEVPVESAGQAARALRYKPDLPVGVVILASRVPSVYYEGWYATLLLDRVIERVVPGVTTWIEPSLDDYFYRLEVPAPEGQFDDIVEPRLIEILENLHRSGIAPAVMEDARAAAIGYLEEDAVRRWFQIFGIESRRLEGIERLNRLSADDVRIAARDFLSARVVASWSPMPKQVTIDVEPLDAPSTSGRPNDSGLVPELSSVPLPVRSPHEDRREPDVLPVPLASGVSIVPSSKHAIFVAPGDLRVFDYEPGSAEVQLYEKYSPQRILVMAPASALPRARQLWSGFTGNPADAPPAPSLGEVANADLPALLVLKAMLDRRLMETGLWSDVRLEIKASEGSKLTISGDGDAQRRIVNWIREIAMTPPSEEDFAWVREAAFHQLDEMKPDLQSLAWLRDRQGIFLDPQSITPAHVQNVARIYFQ